MITYIPREKLESHPDNPRKDLGDLTELTASIRRQGLLQNLTVVPSPEHKGKYRVVIGHRRCAAAGLAGLKELPCVIDEKMTHAEQVAVMMSENLQRSDLTAAEKAGGVQMMMDLGLSVPEISKETGLGESTVYRYAKLSRLDRREMAKAEKRGATLMQFAEIAEIEDDQMRQKAVAAVGTQEYSSVIYAVRAARFKKQALPGLLKVLEKYDVKEVERQEFGKHDWEDTFSYRDEKSADKLEEFFKKHTSYDGSYVIRDYDVLLLRNRKEDPHADEKRRAAVEKQERIKARRDRELKLADRFRESRDEFMKKICGSALFDAGLMRFVLWVMTRDRFIYSLTYGGLFREMFYPELVRDEGKAMDSFGLLAEEVAEYKGVRLQRALVMAAYERIRQAEHRMMDSYKGEYRANDNIEGLYEMLGELGYVPCTEELQWLSGTHEVFRDE